MTKETIYQTSKSSSRTSDGPISQVPDFWYFDIAPESGSSPLEALLMFVDSLWAYYTTNSGDSRHTTWFKELEHELQVQYARQAWKAVRPWVFFSACGNGLTSHVKAWIEAQPRLARTAQRFPFENTALLEVCGSNQSLLQIAKILIDHGAESYCIPGAAALSSLYMAVGFGHEAITNLLLEKRPDLVNAPEPRGLTPLSWAVFKNPPNALSIVQILLNHGASANEACNKLHEYRPLHLAAREQNLDVLKLLLDSGAFIDAQDYRGFTPLMNAIMEDSFQTCQLLLAHGASVGLKDVDGNSLFTVAVLKRANPLIAELLLKYDVDIDARNRLGNSAMHVAARWGQAGSIKLLMDCGIDVTATNSDGRTALHLAAKSREEEIAKMLIASGVDVNVIDIHGLTALSLAVYYGNTEVSRLLVEKTTDINQQSRSGDTPLSTAASYGREALVNLLLNAGAEIGLQEPGPHYPFINPEERLSGYCNDPVLAALGSGHLNIAKRIMEFAGGREEGSEYAEALGLIDIEDMDGLERWSAVRSKNAPENRPDVVLFREKVNARFDKLLKENIQRAGAEVGIPWDDSIFSRWMMGAPS